MNLPIFKVHGIERKKLKKELNELKLFVKYFWHYHQLDKDMSLFFENPYQISDNIARIKFNKSIEKIKTIEKVLIEKYE